MKELHEQVMRFYTSDEYLARNPSLGQEDCAWKVERIIPLVDRYLMLAGKKQINLLDVGGGSGLILKSVSSYMEECGARVDKYALDLSPGILQIQRETNPDLQMALNEDICGTSLGNKQIDLVLLIDVLEHVPDPARALQEVSRIADYAIFKVPLDGYLVGRVWNLTTRGSFRRQSLERDGHINVYTYRSLCRQVVRHAGPIVAGYFANAHRYYNRSSYYRKQKSAVSKALSVMGAVTFRVSPRLAAFIFHDFAMLLVRCR